MSKIEKSAKYFPDPKRLSVFSSKDRKDLEKRGQFMPSSDYDLMPPFWSRPGATQEAWQLPKSYKDVVKWIKLYSESDPYIYSILRMKALYPLSKFKLTGANKSIITFFEQMFHTGVWDIEDTLQEIAFSWQRFGEFTLGMQWDENDKKFIKGVIYDPELIELVKGPFDKFLTVNLEVPPDTIATIKKLMDSKDPADMEKVKNIDDSIKDLIGRGGTKIGLDTLERGDPYKPPEVIYMSNTSGRRGFSQVQPLLKTMLRMDKLSRAQTAIADRYFAPLELWTVGSITGNPDTDIIPDGDTLDHIRDMIRQTLLTPPFSIIYTPILKYEALGVTGKLPTLSTEFDFIENQILIGMGVNKNLILGEGPSWGNNRTISLQKLVMEWKTDRDRWERLLKYYLMEPVCKAHNWKVIEGGIEKWQVPNIEWEKTLDPDGEDKEKDFYKDLWGEGILSTKTLYSKMININYDEERQNLESEKDTIFDNGKRLPKIVTKSFTPETRVTKPVVPVVPGTEGKEETKQEEVETQPKIPVIPVMPKKPKQPKQPK